MTLSKAVSQRIMDLLIKHEMSKYRLEQESGISHAGMRCLFNGRTKDVWLSTVAKVAVVFGLTLAEFFDDPIFKLPEIDF